MLHVYFSSLDTQTVLQVQEARRMWADDAPEIENEQHPGLRGACLIGELHADLAALALRLKGVAKPPPGGTFRGSSLPPY